MIRKKSFKVIDTVYSKSFEDEPQEFLLPSKTDQSYFCECNIYSMLEKGQVAGRPLQFGEQSYDSLEDIIRIKREYQRSFDNLSVEDKLKFGSIEKYVEWVSDPANYVPVVLPEIQEEIELEKDKLTE